MAVSHSPQFNTNSASKLLRCRRYCFRQRSVYPQPAASLLPRTMSAATSKEQNFQLKLQDATVDVERLGELFLINREQMISLDRQRNSTREALTALRKHHNEPKVWMQQSSNSFGRSSTEAATATLQAGA